MAIAQNDVMRRAKSERIRTSQRTPSRGCARYCDCRVEHARQSSCQCHADMIFDVGPGSQQRRACTCTRRAHVATVCHRHTSQQWCLSVVFNSRTRCHSVSQVTRRNSGVNRGVSLWSSTHAHVATVCHSHTSFEQQMYLSVEFNSRTKKRRAFLCKAVDVGRQRVRDTISAELWPQVIHGDQQDRSKLRCWWR